MRFTKMSKRLVGFSLAALSVALLAGCHSHKTKSDATLYSQPATGATGSGYSSSSGYTETFTETQTTPTQTTTETITGPAQGQVSVPLYEEQVIVGTRNVESGGVRLRKEVTTETVTQPVQVRRETITVNREAASGGQASSQPTGKQAGSLATPFEKGEVVIQLHNEEPVVETRIVPSGKIVVQTRTNNEQMNVQRQVRKEKINVEKMGDGQNVIISEKVGGQTEAVGAAPAQQQQIQGKGTKEIIEEKEVIKEYKAPVTTEENAPFPRPQPDGKNTFPDLNKNPEKP